MQGRTHGAGRILLVALTLWALAMVVPDLHRLVQPLGSFGFYANNDGVITDVQGPFPSEAASPAFLAGLRPGDRLDLAQMRCIPIRTPACASALAALGGLRLVSAHRRAELVLAVTDGPARRVAITAEPPPFGGWLLAVLLLDQIAAILVILAAAWLVWTRPGRMTWGFLLYVAWFNPGQSFEFYALLQHSPGALLAQGLAGAILQGAGYAGFIMFALRAPGDASAPRWRPLERVLPLVGVLLAGLLMLSFANVFGYPTEMITRAGVLIGLVVATGAFLILLARRKELPPQDYQRLRWVIWGALIGLPALLVADLGQQTALLADLWPGHAPPEELWGLLNLVNGVLCLFVSEAVRRPRVVTVAIPLRRVTILGLLLSLPALFLHHQIDHLREGISESFSLPGWLWIAIAAALLFLISRVHEFAVHLADQYFNRAVVDAGEHLGDAILNAGNMAAVEGLLVQGAGSALGLASAAVFREDGGVFRRSPGARGWDEAAAQALDPRDPMLGSLRTGHPIGIDAAGAARNRLPAGLMRPVLALPIGDRFRCLGLAVYGPHATGEDLNGDERAMLAELADKAASVFIQLDRDQLRRRIAALEAELAAMVAAQHAPSPSATAKPAVS